MRATLSGLTVFCCSTLQRDFWDAFLPAIASRILYSIGDNKIAAARWTHQDNIVFPRS